MQSTEREALREQANAVAEWLCASLSRVGASVELVTTGTIILQVGRHRVLWILRCLWWHADMRALDADPGIRAAVNDWSALSLKIGLFRARDLATTPETPAEALARSTP